MFHQTTKESRFFTGDNSILTKFRVTIIHCCICPEPEWKMCLEQDPLMKNNFSMHNKNWWDFLPFHWWENIIYGRKSRENRVSSSSGTNRYNERGEENYRFDKSIMVILPDNRNRDSTSFLTGGYQENLKDIFNHESGTWHGRISEFPWHHDHPWYTRWNPGNPDENRC